MDVTVLLAQAASSVFIIKPRIGRWAQHERFDCHEFFLTAFEVGWFVGHLSSYSRLETLILL